MEQTYKKRNIKKIKLNFPKGLQYEDVEFTYKLVPFINKVSFVKKLLCTLCAKRRFYIKFAK